MSSAQRALAPMALCSRCIRHHLVVPSLSTLTIRPFSSASPLREPELQSSQQASSPPPLPVEPHLAATRSQERKLLRAGKVPVGSRRRRVALQTTSDIPFEQLPYQCFQDALAVLRKDREEKIQQIDEERQRIAKLVAKEVGEDSEALRRKENSLRSMRRHLEELKILADINDPLIKKRFEDGHGDMNRPIYRHLADKKWREYKRLVLVQRITQMSVIPDVLPEIDPVVDIDIRFGGRKLQPGAFADSLWSEQAPSLNVQVFDKGERFVTVVVVDSDVPNVEKDSFDHRCHGIWANIPLSPTNTAIHLGRLAQKDVAVLPWLPPYSHKGSPYHRLSIFILQQPDNKKLDVEAIRKKEQRDGFSMRAFVTRNALKPVGATMFRNQWDAGTAAVMRRAGIEGVNLEFKRQKIEPLPYKKKDGKRYR